MTRQSFPHNHNNINRLPASLLLSLLRRMNIMRGSMQEKKVNKALKNLLLESSRNKCE